MGTQKVREKYLYMHFIRCYLTHYAQEQGSRKSKIGWELTKNGCHMRCPGFKKKSHIFVVFKLIIPITLVLCIFYGFQTNLAGNLHFWWLILAGGHLFMNLFQLASQKLLPKSQIGWEHIPTVPIFLEPCTVGCFAKTHPKKKAKSF